MTTFDDRKDAFENKFAHDEELRFKAMARRNKLLGLWAAEKLGKSGAEAEEYAKSVVLADFEEPGERRRLPQGARRSRRLGERSGNPQPDGGAPSPRQWESVQKGKLIPPGSGMRRTAIRAKPISDKADQAVPAHSPAGGFAG